LFHKMPKPIVLPNTQQLMNSIIIIDDHSLFNDGLSLILKESGFFKVVDQIYDSRQAFFKCYSLRPDLVIVDYNMPHLNGLEIVKQINSLDYDCKIVIVSMYADKKEIALFKKEGVDGYINKTTSAADLIQALNAILKGEKVFITNAIEKPKVKKDEFEKKHRLTKRELEILKLIKNDFTTEQIATSLELSYYTVETHRKNIKHKLNFKTKQEYYNFLKSL
jgi:DNA-binding NarL/FixJ family response regulator